MDRAVKAALSHRYLTTAICAALILLAGYAGLRTIAARGTAMYDTTASDVVYDRAGRVIRIAQNEHGQICMFASSYPPRVRDLVLAKEDEWFYFHPGVHPYRSVVAALSRARGVPSGGASTITQQLAKTLLDTAGKRTFTNKTRELMLAFALELTYSKDELLTMYLNTVPLGGNLQGFPAASRAYFDKQVAELNENETLQLIAALSDPNNARPLSETNLARAVVLAGTLSLPSPLRIAREKDSYSAAWLELTYVLKGCGECTSTLDVDLNERVRALLRRHVERGQASDATHGAIAIVDVRQGELLALVGSPDPSSDASGMRINMALQTRPIGSTVKPFLYLLGFQAGLRPYTIAHDREYRYEIETGFPLYPKNYDGAYRGEVTLEEALANSLNVPSVEVLRFTTLPVAYGYFEQTLHLVPPQPFERYAYGIALGGLELDLLSLTHAYTALARGGSLHRLTTGYTSKGEPFYFAPPHSTLKESTTIAEPKYVALVNAILTDRTAGVEQFGQSGSLYLSRPGYAVKTGTSRDYHDSWTIGYTGDYAVGVWLGNAENKPMRGVTGATGAGSLWRDVMELMYTTPYHRGTPLHLGPVVKVLNERGYSYGLANDDVPYARTLLGVTGLIETPHEGDTFLYTHNMRIPLRASGHVRWFANGVPLKNGDAWYPTAPGRYTLEARSDTEEASIEVVIVSEPVNVP